MRTPPATQRRSKEPSPRARSRVQLSAAPASAPRLKLSPNLIIVHTQPGFEGVAIAEATTRFPEVREAGRRSVSERSAMALLEAPAPAALAAMRTAEDLFAVVGYGRGIGPERERLARVSKIARTTALIDAALEHRVRITPGTRAGQRLSFRVLARMVGTHDYRRVDFQHAVESGIVERLDRRWRLAAAGAESRAEVELWATLLDDEFILALRLTDDRMRQRDYKVAHFPGSLRPAVAAAMAWLSQPEADDVVLDPLCGAGTILIERAQIGRYRMLLGGDNSELALAAARENIGPRYKPIELRHWNASGMPLAAGAANKLITNLPWGRKLGTPGELRGLYPALMAEFRRVVAPGGLMVMMAADRRLMTAALAAAGLRPSSILRVSVLGAQASIYLCRNL